MRTNRRPAGPLAASGMVSLWGASSLIKSRQSGFCTLGNASSQGNTTINAVDMTNSICLYNGWYHAITSGTRPRDSWARVALQSATNVRATMDLNGSGVDGVLYWTVVEFMPGIIKSIQRITPTINAASGTTNTTITEVNLVKTFLNWGAWQYSGVEAYNVTDPRDWLAYNTLSTATNVQSSRPGTSTAITIALEVVEFF